MMDSAQNPSLAGQVRHYLEQAYACEQSNELERALLECDLAVQFDPTCAEAHNLRGIVLEGLGQKAQALAAYREAVRLDPAFSEAQENLAEAEAEPKPDKAVGEPSHMAEQASSVEGKSFGIRAGAYVIDNIILLVIGLAIELGIGVLLQIVRMVSGSAIQLDDQTWEGGVLVANVALFFLYFVLFEWLFGASPGKTILRMRVVQQDGGPCTLRAALVRGLMRYIDGMFFAIPAYSSMRRTLLRQRWGDRAAKTVVVSRNAPLIREHRSWWRWGMALALYLVLAVVSTGVAAGMAVRVSPLIGQAASGMNLQPGDLDQSFSLLSEEGRAAFSSSNVKDANQRLFSADGLLVQSRVIVFDLYLSDTVAALETAIQQGLRQEFAGQVLTFEPSIPGGAGDRGALQKFSAGEDNAEGYVLFFIKQNVFVRLVVYGQTGAFTPEEVQTLGQVIEGRMTR